MTSSIEFDSAGVHDIRTGDTIEIVEPDGNTIAGPLTVQTLITVIGDWIHLTDTQGKTYMEGNMRSGSRLITTGLPSGWRFRKLASA